MSIVNSQIYSNTAREVRAHLQKFPSPRWEKCSHACFNSRLHNCGGRSGYAPGNYSAMLNHVYAPQRPEISYRPNWKIADVLAPTHAFHNCERFGQNNSGCVPQRPCKVPIARWETHVLIVVCRAVVLLSSEAQCQS